MASFGFPKNENGDPLKCEDRRFFMVKINVRGWITAENPHRGVLPLGDSQQTHRTRDRRRECAANGINIPVG